MRESQLPEQLPGPITLERVKPCRLPIKSGGVTSQKERAQKCFLAPFDSGSADGILSKPSGGGPIRALASTRARLRPNTWAHVEGGHVGDGVVMTAPLDAAAVRSLSARWTQFVIAPRLETFVGSSARKTSNSRVQMGQRSKGRRLWMSCRSVR